MKVLLYMCVIIISVTLVIAVFKKITKVFLTKKDNLSCVISIVPVNNTTENIEYIVRNLIECKKWGDSYGQYILVITSYSIHYTKLYDDHRILPPPHPWPFQFVALRQRRFLPWRHDRTRGIRRATS